MHDLDRTLEAFLPEQEEEDFFFESEMLEEGPFSEEEEMELASQMLEIASDEELDQFLGGLLKKAGKFFKSGTGKALGRMLKGIAKKALPLAGTAVGTFFGGPVGASLGGKLGKMAGGLFGLEFEGMSEEDANFEVARRFVRLAGTAAQKAAMTSPNLPPVAAAKKAIIEAAKQHAPGLVGGSSFMRRSGRWHRRGNKIILYGV